MSCMVSDMPWLDGCRRGAEYWPLAMSPEVTGWAPSPMCSHNAQPSR